MSDKFRIIDINKNYHGIYADKSIELYSSLCVPSCVNSYSIGIEFVKKWFLARVPENYFKVVYVDNSHVLNEMRDYDQVHSLKKAKPSLAIVPEISLDYDREKIDWQPYGLNQYIKRAEEHGEFFKDVKHNMYISMLFEQLLMNINFRIRVATKAQQIDLYKYLQMSCRIGATESFYIDMDVHIPYELMLQIAGDVGFEIVDNKIQRIGDFIKYLNSHSYLPIILKYRNINGKYEFFIRYPNVCVHIACPDVISADNGEREGQLTTNYILEFATELKIPNPKFYVYYSTQKHDIIKQVTSNDQYTLGMYGLKVFDMPEVNEKGWNQYLTTQILDDDLSKPLEICFKDQLYTDTTLYKILQYNYNNYISPSVFMDIKMFNGAEEVEYDIDWETLNVITKNCLKGSITYVGIYVDLEYINNLINIIKNVDFEKERFNKSVN